MTEYRYNKIHMIFIVIGLLASFVIGWQRHVVEQQSSQVEMVIDYDEVVKLSGIDGIPLSQLLHQFKEAGITSLALYDATLEKLQQNGDLTVFTGAELMSLQNIKGDSYLNLGQVNPERTYIFANRHDPDTTNTFAEVKEDLIYRLGAERVHMLSLPDGRLGISIDATNEDLRKWNLGLSTKEMKLATAYGFNIVARPTNYTKVKPGDIDAVFTRISGFSNVTGIMFAGQEALGFPELMPLTVQHLKERNLPLYMAEDPLQQQFLKQEGIMAMAQANDYKIARVYVIPKGEQPKLKLDEAVHRWVLSDQERNIRVNLMRIFEEPAPGLTLTETNLKYIGDVKNELLAEGFALGKASVYKTYYPATWLLVLIIIGATAAGVLLLTMIKPFPERYQYILFVVLSLLLIWPVLKGGGMLVRQAVAIVSAISFPVMAMTWQLDRWKRKRPSTGSSLTRIVIDGGLGLLVTSLVSLIGGFYVAAILGDVRFMMDMEIYRGVKLTFVMPLVLITLTYLTRFNIFVDDATDSRSIFEQLKKILNYPVYLKTLLLVAFAALAAWVFVGRSGHTAGVPVPSAEIKLRTLLEKLMYARPREKEFLIGHPAFLLAVLALYRNWPRLFHYLLVIGATIAQGSLVETFAHIRTPIYMSFIRGIDGLVLGVILGILAVVAVQVLHYLSFLLGRRTAANE